ncbi:MAG: hypothetical protein J6Y98_04685 [Bacteroidales bacterium]|nr:hypothetical protein [Bacteroidales bacterium]MCR5193317.1 hypothetical protein [Bacteroidales bacterium]
MNYEIKLRNGIGDILFGMPVEDVVQLMGEPDEVENFENALEAPTTLLHYGDNLRLFFEDESPTLQCIDISDESATLFGNKIFDMNEREIVRMMVDNGYYEQDADEEAWGERRISFGEGNVDFFFDNGNLSAIVYGK